MPSILSKSSGHPIENKPINIGSESLGLLQLSQGTDMGTLSDTGPFTVIENPIRVLSLGFR